MRAAVPEEEAVSEEDRSVLHVLPHPGGGGETYVSALSSMPGHCFTRLCLVDSPNPSVQELAHGVARAARHAREHDLLHVHGEGASGACLALLARRPSVVTLHGLHLLRRMNGWRRPLAATNLRLIVRAANRTICVSEAECSNLREAVGTRPVGRVCVVHNGVRLPAPQNGDQRARVRGELGLAESDPVAIWVGSLDERRDPVAVAQAAERAAVALLMVGDGPLRSEVERAARGYTRVLGHRTDVPSLLAASDFFVLASRREGLSFGLLEAMAHRLPAVVTRLPENLEAVGDGGIVVPWADDEALVAALRRLARDGAERRVLGELARRRVASLFAADEMLRRTQEVYDKALAEPRQPAVIHAS